jgi:hypothetical protein
MGLPKISLVADLLFLSHSDSEYFTFDFLQIMRFCYLVILCNP